MNELATCNKTYRSFLWHIDPHCFWCLTETVQPPKGNLMKREVLVGGNDTVATLDHVHSSAKRPKIKRLRATEQTVLACYHCNFQRNNAEQKGRAVIVKRNGWVMVYQADGSVHRDGQLIDPPPARLINPGRLKVTIKEPMEAGQW